MILNKIPSWRKSQTCASWGFDKAERRLDGKVSENTLIILSNKKIIKIEEH